MKGYNKSRLKIWLEKHFVMPIKQSKKVELKN